MLSPGPISPSPSWKTPFRKVGELPLENWNRLQRLAAKTCSSHIYITLSLRRCDLVTLVVSTRLIATLTAWSTSFCSRVLPLLWDSTTEVKGARVSSMSVCTLASCLSMAFVAAEDSGFMIGSSCGVLVAGTLGRVPQLFPFGISHPWGAFLVEEFLSLLRDLHQFC